MVKALPDILATIVEQKKLELETREPDVEQRAELEFRFCGGVITITAIPPIADEYTVQRRRAMDARLSQAHKGPHYGPFSTADEAFKFLRGEIRVRPCH